MKEIIKYLLLILLGAFIGFVLTVILLPKKVSKLSDGSEEVVSAGSVRVSANQYYNKLKSEDSLNILLRHINLELIKAKYPNQEEEAKKFAEKNYETFKQSYEMYGMNEKDALSQYGYRSKEDFIQYISEDYYINKYVEDTLGSRVNEEELKQKYIETYFPTKHVVIFSNSSSKNDLSKIKKALKTKKLSDVLRTYTSTPYNEIDIDFVTTIYGEDILNKVKLLNANETSAISSNDTYGNYFIYVESVEESQDFATVKSNMLSAELEKMEQEDPYIVYKVMIDLQKENNIDFKDEVLKEKYEEYVKEYYK